MCPGLSVCLSVCQAGRRDGLAGRPALRRGGPREADPPLTHLCRLIPGPAGRRHAVQHHRLSREDSTEPGRRPDRQRGPDRTTARQDNDAEQTEQQTGHRTTDRTTDRTSDRTSEATSATGALRKTKPRINETCWKNTEVLHSRRRNRDKNRRSWLSADFDVSRVRSDHM